jgi:polyhydroxyalkanoate synthesis regulator phasin
MSDDEKGKVGDKAGEIAKNIWLAGVGAYGKAVEDAQGRLEKAMEPPKLFRDLVKAGTALEEDAKEVIVSTTLARQSVEERIGRVRENFHNQRPARMEDLAQLHKKIAKLTRKVDKLSKALDAQGGSKAPAKKQVSAKPKAKAKAKTKPKNIPVKKKSVRSKATIGKRKA